MNYCESKRYMKTFIIFIFYGLLLAGSGTALENAVAAASMMLTVGCAMIDDKDSILPRDLIM